MDFYIIITEDRISRPEKSLAIYQRAEPSSLPRLKSESPPSRASDIYR